LQQSFLFLFWTMFGWMPCWLLSRWFITPM